jgi:FkbM family methyltransferase
LKFNIKQRIKIFGQLLGIEISSFPTAALKSRKQFMKIGKFDVVLDVGANVGQFGKEIRALGYLGQIVSFEPLSSAFSILKKTADLDKQWIANNFALGSYNETTEINISQHSASSSLLNFDDNYILENKNLTVINTEKIEVKKLDDIFIDYIHSESSNVLLKLDTQGFEKAVLEGSLGILDRIQGIQIETSLKELYQGETLFVDMLVYLQGLGFEIFTLEPYYYEANSHQLLQAEVYLLNKNFARTK